MKIRKQENSQDEFFDKKEYYSRAISSGRQTEKAQKRDTDKQLGYFSGNAAKIDFFFTWIYLDKRQRDCQNRFPPLV